MSHDHSPTPESARSSTGIFLVVGVLILLLAAVVGALWLNRSESATETEDLARAAVRTKNLSELQAADSNSLTTYGWNDQAKGVVHIPITKAMELILPSLQASSNKAPKGAQP